MLNTININLKTDIKTDKPTTLPITLMSQDKNNNQFILRFTNGGEPVDLDSTYTVEILTKFKNSGASRLTSATVRQDYATWEFDTAYITQDETVYNYVYVRKSGNLVVSADANCFVFSVDLSEIDKDAGRVAETYDENYEKYLDEFKDNVDFEEIAQAEQARKEAETLREENYNQKVDTAIVEADVVEKVDNKVTELTPKITELIAQLAQTKSEAERKRKLEDLDSEVLSAIEGGEGTSFDLLSIPQDKSVSPIKTTFFKHGKNLFNKDVAKQGFYVNHNTGGLIANASYTASDYMEVLPNTNYSFSFEANNRIAFYTDQKQFISGASVPTMPITTPINAKFAVISFVNNRLDVQQFELGAVNTSYEPYIGWVYDIGYLKDGSVTSEKLAKLGSEVFNDNSLTPEKMTFFKSSKNLYNKATSLQDRSIAVATGNIPVNVHNIASDFIPVESGEYYSLSPYNTAIRLAFYDSYKNYVSGLSDPANPILVPENGAYVRYSYSGNFEDVRQFEKGQSVTPYEPYYESMFDVETIGDNTIPMSKLKGGATLGGGVSDEILVDMKPTIIEFYMKGSNPDSSRYLKYSFKKEERAFDDTKSNGNLEAWRLVDLLEVERIGGFSFTNVYSESLTTDGVWEFALKEKNQPQFMGGAHGNEVLTDVFMLVDGIQKELGTAETFTCNNIQFVQKSTIYRVFTQTPLANVVKAYDITAKDGIKITAEFDWIESIVLEGGSFFPMLPIKRTLTDNVTQITDRFVRDSDYDIKDISTTSSVVSSGASEAVTDVVESSMWGQDSGISVKITSLKKAKENEAMYIAASDLFNKFYYQIVGRSDYTVDAGEKMKSTALFKFNTIN